MEALESSSARSADRIASPGLSSPLDHAASLRDLPARRGRNPSTLSCPESKLTHSSASETSLVGRITEDAPIDRVSQPGKPSIGVDTLPPRFGEIRTDMAPAPSFNAYDEEQQNAVALRRSRTAASSAKKTEAVLKGWTLSTSPCGQTCYIHPETKQKWVAAESPAGERYFYEPKSRVSVWELPDVEPSEFDEDEEEEVGERSTTPPTVPPAAGHMVSSFTRGNATAPPPNESSVITTIDLSEAQAKFGARQQPSPSGTTKTGGFPVSLIAPGACFCGHSVARIWRTLGAKKRNIEKYIPFFGDKKRHSVDSLDQPMPAEEADGRFYVQRISRDHISGPVENKLRATERRGPVNRTKYSVNGERVPKKWIPSLLVLAGPTLYVYKDVKGQKLNLQPSKAELHMQVKNLVIEVADSSHTSRDNCLLVRDNTESGDVVDYLFQAPSLVLRKAWETAFQYSQNWVQEDRFASHAYSTKHPPSVDSKIITMLQNFFRIRPSVESLRLKGIIKNEPVFGSVLCELCAREQTKVPTFVTRVIGAIEARGLNLSGLYRKSGNAATIQNLRNQVNHHDYSLNSHEWGIFELSDALKLFLRELKEPLMCYSVYDRLLAFYKTYSRDSFDEKMSAMRSILESMPECHFYTARAVFLHMHKIASYSAENQMTPENLALVLAPNIMWPELPTAQFDAYAHASFCVAHFAIVNAPKLFEDPPSLPTTF